MDKNGITILQSVYYKDNSEHLDFCLQSLYQQTIKINRIVIVKDGKIPDELENVLIKWQSLLPLFVVGYSQNKGLAFALNYGLSYCEDEIIARMDSDDICYHDRIEKQLNYLNNNPDVVLLSGYIDEFYQDENKIQFTRKVPIEHDDIKKYLKKRNAFNHMAVMFKKSAILSVGGYRQVDFFEDYALWIQLIQRNFKVANIPEKLVKARIGNDMIGRRHGKKYAKHEMNFFFLQYKNNFISLPELIILVCTRIPLRFLPKRLLIEIYRILRG